MPHSATSRATTGPRCCPASTQQSCLQHGEQDTPAARLREEGYPHLQDALSCLPKITGEGKSAEEEQHLRAPCFKSHLSVPAGDTASPLTHTTADGSRPARSPPAFGAPLPPRGPAAMGHGQQATSLLRPPRDPHARACQAAAGREGGNAGGDRRRPGPRPVLRAPLTANALKRPETRRDGGV